LKKYIRDPQVHAQTMIRLSIFGAVGKPGFYQVPADQLAGDAIMTAAGGPAGNADPHKTTVRRGGVEIWSKEAFQQALVEGVTLDRLNLRAGDEIRVGEQKHTNIRTYFSAVTALSSLYFLLSRVF
jgi:protein involved in polysaccharide export with SLBB domain